MSGDGVCGMCEGAVGVMRQAAGVVSCEGAGEGGRKEDWEEGRREGGRDGGRQPCARRSFKSHFLIRVRDKQKPKTHDEHCLTPKSEIEKRACVARIWFCGLHSRTSRKTRKRTDEVIVQQDL